MAGNSTDPGRSVTNKVTAILLAFTDGAVLTLTEIAGSARLPTSTAHRLASELLAWRLLERTEEGGYRIGLPLRIIGKDATDLDALNRVILIMRVRPVLIELAATARADAKLGVLSGHEVVCIGQSDRDCVAAGGVTGDGLVSALPAYATAMGQALLAFSPARVVDRAIADGQMSNTTIAPEQLRRILAMIRLTQIATMRDAYDDRTAIAMPVFSGGGRVTAAIELSVREPGTDLKAVTAALTVACRSLSRQLATESGGHRGFRSDRN